jgi:hypothetical protein
MQALLGGFTSEARWLRHADRHLRHLFPYLPRQSGYNKRLRGAAMLLRHAIRAIATDTSLWTDDVWIIDSTPVECGRSRETTKRSELAGWAQYGYCASHSRYLLGSAAAPAVHPAWPAGHLCVDRRQGRRARGADRPVGRRAGAGGRPARAGIDRRQALLRPPVRGVLAELGVRLLRPARKGEPKRPGAQLFKPLRQLIESVNDTLKGQLDLERHGGRTPGGVAVRVLQRILVLASAIWNNHKTGQPTLRSLVAYDH